MNRANRLLVPVACMLALAAAIVSYRSNVGLWPDSVNYLDTARSLLAGNGLSMRVAHWDPVYERCQLPTRTSMWPPGYPALLALVSLTGLSPYEAGRIISMISFAMLPCLYYLLSRLWIAPVYALLVAVALTCHATTFSMSADVSSEPVFLALTLATLYCCVRSTEAFCQWHGWITAAALFAAAVFLIRYVGIVCIGVAGLVVMTRLWACSPKERLRPAICLLFLGSTLAAVFGYNYAVSGIPTQPWAGGLARPGEVLITAMRSAATRAIRPEALRSPPLHVLGPIQTVAAALVALVAALGLKRFSKYKSAEGRDEKLGYRGRWILMLFLAAYVALLVVKCVRDGVSLEIRYLEAVVPIAALLFLSIGLDPCYTAFRGSPDVVAACAGITAAVQLIICVRTVNEHDDALLRRYLSSSVHTFVQSLPDDKTLLTNFAAPLAWNSENPVLALPRRPFSANGVRDWGDVDDLAERCKCTTLIHYKGFPPSLKSQSDPAEHRFLRSLDDPADGNERVLAEFEDAVVYRVGPETPGL